MKSAAQYIADAKAVLGDVRMSDRELGDRLGGLSQQFISGAKRGQMTDPLAVKIAEVLGIEPGEVLMVARLEREKDETIRSHLKAWALKTFALMPTMEEAAPLDLVAGGVRAANGKRADWRKR